jgi:hypothetical protein
VTDEPAPSIVAAGQTPYGGAIIVTISGEQIRHLAEVGVTATWLVRGRHLALGYISDEGPLASFDMSNREHRRTLEYALERGTFHICSAEGYTEGAMLPRDKLGVTLEPADRRIIENALSEDV